MYENIVAAPAFTDRPDGSSVDGISAALGWPPGLLQRCMKSVCLEQPRASSKARGCFSSPGNTIDKEAKSPLQFCHPEIDALTFGKMSLCLRTYAGSVPLSDIERLLPHDRAALFGKLACWGHLPAVSVHPVCVTSGRQASRVWLSRYAVFQSPSVHVQATYCHNYTVLVRWRGSSFARILANPPVPWLGEEAWVFLS